MGQAACRARPAPTDRRPVRAGQRPALRQCLKLACGGTTLTHGGMCPRLACCTVVVSSPCRLPRGVPANRHPAGLHRLDVGRRAEDEESDAVGRKKICGVAGEHPACDQAGRDVGAEKNIVHLTRRPARSGSPGATACVFTGSRSSRAAMRLANSGAACEVAIKLEILLQPPPRPSLPFRPGGYPTQRYRPYGGLSAIPQTARSIRKA